MKNLFFLFLLFHGNVFAEFYRCKIDDKITYQSKPCQQGVNSKQIEIKEQHYGKTRNSLKRYMVKTEKDAKNNANIKSLRQLQKQKEKIEHDLRKEIKGYLETVNNSPTTPTGKRNKGKAQDRIDILNYKYSIKLKTINDKITTLKKKTKTKTKTKTQKSR